MEVSAELQTLIPGAGKKHRFGQEMNGVQTRSRYWEQRNPYNKFITRKI
jgi:hypothetical protein